MRRLLAASALALATWLAAPAARATETCGNGSPDGDLRADEGCYAWVCEQPLDCNLTGTVAPETGGLYYRVAPDLAPVVPYGPSITFQRFYTSLYEQTPAATNYRAPLGYRWQHNWMGWLEKFTAPNPDQVVLHMTDGREVLFEKSSSDTTYDYYTPQAGYFFAYLRQYKVGFGSGAYDWELRTHTGEVYVYDGTSTGNHVAKLIKVKDSVGNAVTVSYNGSGQVYQVKDASQQRYLQLEYFTTGNKPIQYVKYYAGGSLQVTVEFTYPSADYLGDVKQSSTVLEHYDYTEGHLTAVKDSSSGNTVAGFAYYKDAIARIETGQGDLGFGYDPDSNQTTVYFHRASATACDGENPCDEDQFCGGIDSGDTGACFRAYRVVTYDLVAGEPVPEAVEGSPGCGNLCVGVADYECVPRASSVSNRA